MSTAPSHPDAARVRALFDEALAHPPDARAAFLDRQCRGDERLRAAVEALLRADAHAQTAFQMLDRPEGAPPDDAPPDDLATQALPPGVALVAAPPPAPPRRVAHFEIEEKIGQGGMGVVYRARDLRLHRTVALKFLPPHLSRDAEAKARFVREAQSASSLDHDNICTIYEIGETGEQLFIAMACYDGETLRRKIARGPLPVAQALGYATQVARGLERAHEAAIVHRDVKPANVIVTERGVAKLVDFGIAKLQGEAQLTQTGATLGTVAYMSPEQVRGEGTGPPTDVWSLGAVLYEMLTGRRPFGGGPDRAVLYAILHEEPAPVATLRPDVPAALSEVIGKALAKDPAVRYADAGAFRDDLEALGREETLRGWSQRRSWRRVLPVGGLLLAALLALAALLLASPETAALSFAERDWLLVTDFENRTGEAVFDHALSAALAVSIGQSRYVNLLPEQRVAEVLRRMRRPDTVRVDAALGREIARREGVGMLLVPGISRVGQGYVLTATLRDAETGEDLRARLARAGDEDGVLDALDSLAGAIRRDLGETLPAIAQQSRPLDEVTTASLDALEQYALGREQHLQAHFEQAAFHYERALELDDAFTVARAALGLIHLYRAGDPWAQGYDADYGRRLLSDAARQVDDLTDAERFIILAHHARFVEADPDEAARYFQMLLDLYPDRYDAHQNLARIYHAAGRYEEAARYYKAALRLDPYAALSHNGLLMMYIFQAGRLDSALVWGRRYAEQNPAYHDAHSLLAYTYLGLDSLDQAEAALARALEREPPSGRDLFRMARVRWLQGRHAEATAPLEQLQKTMPGTWADYWLAVLYDHLGQTERAADQHQLFREIADGWVRTYPAAPGSHAALGLALTHAGQPEPGWEAAQQALEVGSNAEGAFMVARVASQQGRTAEALDLLEASVAEGYTDYVWIKIHPDFEPISEHPRFLALLDRHLKR